MYNRNFSFTSYTRSDCH